MTRKPSVVVWVWGAVKTPEGFIQPRIKQVEAPWPANLGSEDFRTWKSAVMDGERYEDDCDCTLTLSCIECQATAVRWWTEWERRRDKRIWMSGRSVGDSFKSCNHRHKSKKAAVACALKEKFPELWCMDGHGATIFKGSVFAATKQLQLGF